VIQSGLRERRRTAGWISDACALGVEGNPVSTTTQRAWLAKLARLRVDRKDNPAPHKPLLLLVLIEMAEQGLLPHKVLTLTPEIAFRFCTYWTIVAYRRTQKPDVRYPFYHLQSDGCWQTFEEKGRPAPDRRLARFAELNPDFEACLNDPVFRGEARRVLICTYFPRVEWSGLCVLLDLPAFGEDEAASASPHLSSIQAEQKGREARFRLDIVSSYHYTCALTGFRILLISSGSIVDAAHIHEFADSRNNDVRNGIALCKNAHWLFDNGLWTITDDYTISIAMGKFSEDSPDQRPLSEYDGQKIRLPNNPAHYPDPVHLAWHRRKKFLGAT
jgi:putative restriction endonuclease